MKFDVIYKVPKAVSLIVTDKCTAACHNCCFKCNPKNNNTMTLVEIKNIIDQVVLDFPTVEACVFTGGECTLLDNDLKESIRYAHKLGLVCRIVTNGYWAKNLETAFNFLKILKSCGLDEINLSTGEQHQKWVPYDRISNACKVAIRLHLPIAINVESTPTSTFTSEDILKDAEILGAYQKGQVIIKDSLWIEFDKKNVEAEELNKGRCTYLFNTISVSPDMYLLACCGLTCQSSNYLKLGSLRKYSIKTLWQEQYDDFLKLWLYTCGPYEIYSFLCKKKNIEIQSNKYPHICSLCQHVLDKDNMKIIKDNIMEIAPSVFLKYKLLTN